MTDQPTPRAQRLATAALVSAYIRELATST